MLFFLLPSSPFLTLPCPPAPPDVAREREVDGDVMMTDLGQGLPFRAGAFDGAISISALQWLCNADRKEHVPPKRLYKFFSALYGCLVSAGWPVVSAFGDN